MLHQKEAVNGTRDDVILFGKSDGIYSVSAEGGEATRVTALDSARKEQYHVMPWYLPDIERQA